MRHVQESRRLLFLVFMQTSQCRPPRSPSFCLSHRVSQKPLLFALCTSAYTHASTCQDSCLPPCTHHSYATVPNELTLCYFDLYSIDLWLPQGRGSDYSSTMPVKFLAYSDYFIIVYRFMFHVAFPVCQF